MNFADDRQPSYLYKFNYAYAIVVGFCRELLMHNRCPTIGSAVRIEIDDVGAKSGFRVFLFNASTANIEEEVFHIQN